MSEAELTGNEVGAGEQVVASEGATEQPVAAAAAPAIAPVDLTKSEEFKKWQAGSDRRAAQLEAQLAQAAQQTRAMQGELEQFRLADADPEEAAKYYQTQLAQMRQEFEQAQALSAAEQQIDNRAMALLSEHGLDPDTPGLDWDGGRTEKGLTALAVSVAAIERQRVNVQAKAKEAEVNQATQAARTEALTQAGVTKVSTGTGAAATPLRSEYEAKRSKLISSGNTSAYLALQAEYRGKGLKV